MTDFGFNIKSFAITILAFFLLCLLPIKCFSQSKLSEAESRVCREKLVEEAKKYVGSPYVRGSTGPDSFDCSGLVYTVARNSIEFQLPRTVKAMYSYVKIIPLDKIEKGDLVFFKTTGDGSISHVGLYIGKGQFISAVSDGPNTGVIVSSLKENYWKTHYASCGKFLASANYEESELSENDKNALKVASYKGSSSKTSSYKRNSKSSVSDNLYLMGTLTTDWSLFTTEQFMPNFRGLSSEVDIVYEGKTFSPGAGFMFRWNYGVGSLQLPVIFSLFFGDYVRAYAGPVFTIGSCNLPGNDKEIKPSIFPGVLGVTFNTPSLTKGSVKVQVIQDICYSVFNNTSNAALSPLESFSAGLEFCTGVRVTFPMKSFFRK